MKKDSNMNVDRYYLQARLIPALLTAIPALIFFHALLNPKLEILFSDMMLLTEGTGLSFSIALVFLWVQLSKMAGRSIFQRLIFEDELRMPTTNFLLYRDPYFTPETKRQIRKKIEDIFQLRLYNYKQEKQQELNARKQICLAVSQIREQLRQNQMLLRHNIDYGFFKNLISGSMLAFFLCVSGLLLGRINPAVHQFSELFMTLGSLYFIPLLFSRSIMMHFARYYGKILYEQFLMKS